MQKQKLIAQLYAYISLPLHNKATLYKGHKYKTAHECFNSSTFRNPTVECLSALALLNEEVASS